jgi:hypothetical protein
MRAALVVVLVLFALAPAAASAPSSGLRGKVTLSPASPVCIEDQPCSKPARGVVLTFHRNGRVAARATTTEMGTYRVALRPGRYAVKAPRFRIGSGVAPSAVLVLRGMFLRVDLDIDTGLQ